MMTRRLVCVLPTRNESETILNVLDGLLNELEKVTDLELVKIILTDDSTDRTREIASSKAIVEIVEGGGALGRAMFRGLKQSLKYNPDVVMSLDSDGQLDLSEIHTFLKEFKEKNADLILGSRFLKGDLIEYSYPKINKFGVVLLSTFLTIACAQKITDSHGGLRVMSSALVEKIKVAGRHTYVQETIIYAAKNGFRVHEVESVWKERISGESRVVAHIPKYIVRTLPYILYRAGYDMKIILPLGIALGAISYFAGFTLVACAFFIRILGMMGDRRDVL